MLKLSSDHYFSRMSFLVKDKYYYLLMLTVGIIFYILNMQTPFSHDDYAYCFYYDADSYTVRPTDIRVTGVWQMFESMWHHYLCVNGRFVSHTLLQCFCAFWGKGVFNVCNTIVFMFFLNTIVLLSGHKCSVFVLLFVFFFALFLLPFPGQTMLWMTGSINYLWTTTFSLVYFYWLRKQEHHYSSALAHICVFMLCVAIGWTNESVTVPVALGLFFYFIFNRDQFKGIIITSYIGYALGAALIVLGPGTFSRLSSGGEISTKMDSIQFLFLHIYNTLYQYIYTVFPVLVIIGTIITLFVKKSNRKGLLRNIYVWLFLAFTLFLFALGMDEERMYFGVGVFSLLILIRMGNSLISYMASRWYFCIVVMLLCVLPVKAALQATKGYMEYDMSVYDEVKRAPEKCVVRARSYDRKSRYVYVTLLQADRYAFHNRVKAFYYGKEYIQALPDDLYDAVVNKKMDSLLTVTDRIIDGKPLYEFSNYWLLSVDEIPDYTVTIVYYYWAGNENLDWKQKKIRYLLNTLNKEVKSHQALGVECNGKSYLLFPQDSICCNMSICR